MKEKTLTKTEQAFYSYLKKALMLRGFDYEFKVSLYDLIKDSPDIMMGFGNQINLINDIEIDIVLKRKGKVVAGIEVIDEPDEISNVKGENMLKDILFARLRYEYYKVTDLDKLKEAADTIKRELLKKIG